MVSLFSALRISLSREPPFSYSLSSLIQKGRRVAINSLEKKSRYLSSLAEIDEPENDGVQDDIKATEKDTALHLALSQLAGESESESTMCLQRFFGTRQVPVISTGSLKLDLALGTGGLPRGRFVEIYGQEACGKTTLALHIIKEAQKLGGTCAYFDAENAMDPSLAESMGIDIENLIVSRPNTAENLLSAVDTLAKSGSVDVIVVDSVAALVPQYEVDVSIGEVRKDLLSTIMSKGLRKIHYSLSDSETLVVFVNQIRINSQLKQGSEHAVEETCGGNALKFYAAVRLRIKRTGLLKTEDEVTGLGISIQVMKNKLAPAMKKADLGLIFGRGFCSVSEVLDLGCEYGLIMNEGSAYHIEGEVFSDQLEAKHYLAENKEVFDKMDMAAFNCLALIQGRHGQCYLDPESLTLLKEALSLKTVIEAELRSIVLKACTPTGTKIGLLMAS